MKKISLFVLFAGLFLCTSAFASPQRIHGLYVNTFGDSQKPAIIFVHGGPGFDSQDFEITTAPRLASEGFYVVVYDQRGQGRSDVTANNADYSYHQYADDLNEIIQTWHLDHPVLIGHSHGGPISLQFDQRYPGVASKIILVSAPINFWDTINSLVVNCRAAYERYGNTARLAELNADFAELSSPTVSVDREIVQLAAMFDFANRCGLYFAHHYSDQARALFMLYNQHRVTVPQENAEHPMGAFVVNDNYAHLDQTEFVRSHAEHIYGIYGDEDGLFLPTELTSIHAALAGNSQANSFTLFSGAAHALFIDHQDMFVNTVKAIAR